MAPLQPHVRYAAVRSGKLLNIIRSIVKSGRWGGVVVAFIFMSDIRDEIDWEFPGNSTTSAQTNYFWQGYACMSQLISLCSKPPLNTIAASTENDGETMTGIQDTYGSYHAYTVSAPCFRISGCALLIACPVPD
jgi:hypothetical protein